MKIDAPLVRHLGRLPYDVAWSRMRAFTDERTATTRDEIWALQHPPVFTLGHAADPGHLLAPGDIPVVHTDRGGQVTYHGPGQTVIYCLVDLRRRGIGVRDWVALMEQAVIRRLARIGIDAAARADAPGVYVAGRKIASLGLRVRRGCTYHGIAFNVDLDLAPFGRINPCGHVGLEVTRSADLGVAWSVEEAAEGLTAELLTLLDTATPVSP